MCNRYRTRKANAALWDEMQGWREPERFDEHGRNLPLPFESFPNTPGRVICLNEAGKLIITEPLWGLPTPAEHLVTKTGKPMAHDPGQTNVRNTFAQHWKPFLGVESRCLVPWTSFCEPDQVGRTYKPKWFALADGRDDAYFAGVRATLSRQIRAKDAAPTQGEFFAFLTTKANAEVAQFHDKAMPVILTTLDEAEAWLTEPWSTAKRLQRPLPDGSLKVIEEDDGPVEAGENEGFAPGTTGELF